METGAEVLRVSILESAKNYAKDEGLLTQVALVLEGLEKPKVFH